ncbi:aspartate kinase [Parabacteroides bouchesdurhonensis]|uniref:aspartate kinase n=1 Tax=Parabacteroides bouchesdurhonensis TaxID=1936995 RepID=UPI000E48116B|nr:aspartate kinase [Parabacteroides bouchesdurhonensis]RHJ91028.1 aspartate kinase [Bacteroides sp. AM07-16]
MKVLKFGGTSVGSAQRMKNVVSIIHNGEPKIVVLSAMSGTTNSLVDIAGCFYRKNIDEANKIISRLEQTYACHIEELYASEAYREKALELVMVRFNMIWTFANKPFTAFDEKVVLAQGELISTGMMHLYLQEQGIRSALLPALDFMRINAEGEPDMTYIERHLNGQLAGYSDTEIFVTQGFICRNAYGEVDNLQRGGSDYSASLIGAAIHAEEIQIWTDIDGMHNNDPRVVHHTAPVRQLNFEEAAKLAYFGAKILHPYCIRPAKENNIPVRLLNSLQPEVPGTLISNTAEKGRIKAVAAKDNIVFVKMKSLNILPSHKFLSLVFDTFAVYKTAVDMVTTSDIGVSVTIDNPEHLQEIVSSLEKYATIYVERNMVIVCVVGDLEWQNVGFEARIVDALKDIPVRMISYGGSSSNVSLVMKVEDKTRALQALSTRLFSKPDAAESVGT